MRDDVRAIIARFHNEGQDGRTIRRHSTDPAERFDLIDDMKRLVAAVERDDDEYNGWKNRETWAAALHLSNDQGLYGWAVDTVADHSSTFAAGEAIRDQLEEWAEELFHGEEPSVVPHAVVMMLDEIGSRWRVDWTAVAASFANEDYDR